MGKGMPELALADGVLQHVLESPAGDTMALEDNQVDQFRERMEANFSDTFFGLTGEDGDAARVAALATRGLKQ